mmetsp:Transcript_25639/g.36157  ORF Transcript_25639/g.36157 Transcript_25639/m.36157 type:complete len:101 (+) Transcript_25639:1377-1679(+)
MNQKNFFLCYFYTTRGAPRNPPHILGPKRLTRLFFVFASFFVVIQELVHDDIDSSSMKCIQKKETKIQKITPPKMKQHQIQKKKKNDKKLQKKIIIIMII